MITIFILIINILFGSDVTALGSPNFAVRDSKQRQLQNTVRGMIVYQLGKYSQDAEIRFRCTLLKSSDTLFLTVTEYKAALFLTCNESEVNKDEALNWVDEREVLKKVAVKLRLWNKEAMPYWVTHEIAHHKAVIYFVQSIRWQAKSAKVWRLLLLGSWLFPTSDKITYTNTITTLDEE